MKSACASKDSVRKGRPYAETEKGNGTSEGLAADCDIPGLANHGGSTLGKIRHAGYACRPARAGLTGRTESMAWARDLRTGRDCNGICRSQRRIEARTLLRPEAEASAKSE